MSRKLVWTAFVSSISLSVVLIAQGCSSRKELLVRLRRDDPIWNSSAVFFMKHKRLKGRHRGLIIKAIPYEHARQIQTFIDSTRNRIHH